jgi:transcriptional regulator with XRE-family HTH domain
MEQNRLQQAEDDVGMRLRYLRTLKRLRLSDLAKQVGCSPSLLSKVENGKAHPSFKILRKLVNALDSDLAFLFFMDTEPQTNVFRKGHRPKITLKDGKHDNDSIEIECMTGNSREFLMVGNIHIIKPGHGLLDFVSHKGEEVGYVLEGKIEITIGNKKNILREGDSFHFVADIPHKYRNPGKDVCKVIWVNTPRTF